MESCDQESKRSSSERAQDHAQREVDHAERAQDHLERECDHEIWAQKLDRGFFSGFRLDLGHVLLLVTLLFGLGVSWATTAAQGNMNKEMLIEVKSRVTNIDDKIDKYRTEQVRTSTMLQAHVDADVVMKPSDCLDVVKPQRLDPKGAWR